MPGHIHGPCALLMLENDADVCNGLESQLGMLSELSDFNTSLPTARCNEVSGKSSGHTGFAGCSKRAGRRLIGTVPMGFLPARDVSEITVLISYIPSVLLISAAITSDLLADVLQRRVVSNGEQIRCRPCVWKLFRETLSSEGMESRCLWTLAQRIYEDDERRNREQ